jgi:hypothetical protein
MNVYTCAASNSALSRYLGKLIGAGVGVIGFFVKLVRMLKVGQDGTGEQRLVCVHGCHICGLSVWRADCTQQVWHERTCTHVARVDSALSRYLGEPVRMQREGEGMCVRAVVACVW